MLLLQYLLYLDLQEPHRYPSPPHPLHVLGFDPLEGWALKEISDRTCPFFVSLQTIFSDIPFSLDIQVPIEDLPNPGADTSSMSHSRLSITPAKSAVSQPTRTP